MKKFAAKCFRKSTIPDELKGDFWYSFSFTANRTMIWLNMAAYKYRVRLSIVFSGYAKDVFEEYFCALNR